MRLLPILVILLCSKPVFGQVNDAPSPPALSQIEETPLLASANGDVFTFASNGASYQVWLPTSPNHSLVDALSSPEFQKQIEFSDSQNKEFREMRNQYDAEISKTFKEFQKDIKGKSAYEVKKLNKSLVMTQTKLREDYSSKIRETLVPNQIAIIKSVRFKKVVAFQGFSSALSQGPFLAEFKTTDKQKKELAAIRDKTEAAIQKKIQTMRAEAKKEMVKLLDRKQRKLLEKLENGNDEAVVPKLRP